MYFPVMKTKKEFVDAYSKVKPECRANIVPIIEICQTSNFKDISSSETLCRSLMKGNAPIIDISNARIPDVYVKKDAAPTQQQIEDQNAQDQFSKEIEALLDSKNSFENWRRFVGKFPRAVPVLQYRNLKTEAKAVIGQAAHLLFSGQKSVAIRVRVDHDPIIYDVIDQIAFLVPEGGKIVVLVDCGQSRGGKKTQTKVRFAAGVINEVRRKVPHARLGFILLADSFSSLPDKIFHFWPSDTWLIWWGTQNALDGNEDDRPKLHFGDYCGSPAFKGSTTFIPGWVAKVILPLVDGWQIYRDNNNQDADGWERGCKKIGEMVEAKELSVPNGCWGVDEIINGSEALPNLKKRPGFWEAVKLNIHLTQQALPYEERFNYCQEKFGDF